MSVPNAPAKAASLSANAPPGTVLSAVLDVVQAEPSGDDPRVADDIPRWVDRVLVDEQRAAQAALDCDVAVAERAPDHVAFW